MVEGWKGQDGMGEGKKIEIAAEEDVKKYGTPAGDPEASDLVEKVSAGEAEPAPEAVRKELAETREKLLRAKADFQNLQRRMQQEKAGALRYANADFARSLLPSLDDFERAFEAFQADNATVESVMKGVRLVYNSLVKALTDHHVTEINPNLEPFDPHVHEAVMQQPSEEHPNRTVLQTVQKGYQLHDRVLRPAKVIVSSSESEEVDATDIDAEETKPSDEESTTE